MLITGSLKNSDVHISSYYKQEFQIGPCRLLLTSDDDSKSKTKSFELKVYLSNNSIPSVYVGKDNLDHVCEHIEGIKEVLSTYPNIFMPFLIHQQLSIYEYKPDIIF